MPFCVQAKIHRIYWPVSFFFSLLSGNFSDGLVAFLVRILLPPELIVVMAQSHTSRAIVSFRKRLVDRTPNVRACNRSGLRYSRPHSVDGLHLAWLLEPTVWSSNEFPPGSFKRDDAEDDSTNSSWLRPPA